MPHTIDINEFICQHKVLLLSSILRVASLFVTQIVHLCDALMVMISLRIQEATVTIHDVDRLASARLNLHA